MPTSICRIAQAVLLRFFWLLCCLLLPVTASSNDLYTVQVPIYEDTDKALGAAKSRAFLEVIGKITSTKSSWKSPHIQASKNNIDGYFDNISQVVVKGEDLPYLRLKFNAQAINTLIKTAGLPIWDGLRPKLLVWLVERDFVDPFILASDNQNAQAFIEEGNARGLSVIFPIMDLEDTFNISALDIEAQRLDSIRQTSVRYQADIILIGTMFKQANGKWQLQGQVLTPQNVNAWQAGAVSMEQLTDLAMENIGMQLSEVYARQPTNLTTNQLLLQVDGIDNINKYAQVQKQLQKISRITDVQIHQVNKQALTLIVAHEGSKIDILANIDLIQPMQRILPKTDASTINTLPSLKDTSPADLESMLDAALDEEQLVTKSSIVPPIGIEYALYQWQ